jgi:hypothetical protein
MTVLITSIDGRGRWLYTNVTRIEPFTEGTWRKAHKSGVVIYIDGERYGSPYDMHEFRMELLPA